MLNKCWQVVVVKGKCRRLLSLSADEYNKREDIARGYFRLAQFHKIQLSTHFHRLIWLSNANKWKEESIVKAGN